MGLSPTPGSCTLDSPVVSGPGGQRQHSQWVTVGSVTSVRATPLAGLLKFAYKLVIFFLSFGIRVSLCSPGWPGTNGPPVSSFAVLGLKEGTTTSGFKLAGFFFFNEYLVRCKNPVFPCCLERRH
jgi:hypothetical protein